MLNMIIIMFMKTTIILNILVVFTNPNLNQKQNPKMIIEEYLPNLAF